METLGAGMESRELEWSPGKLETESRELERRP